MKRPVIIGIAGGSASGKTSVARRLVETFDDTNTVTIIRQDDYYHDQSHMPFQERLKTNYDHPDAFDNELLVSHLKTLLEGKDIEKPIYDFSVHTRKEETVKVEPRDIIILEGILVLSDPEIRNLLDIKIYVDTDADVRIIRRLVRDINERGRTVDSVINQYLTVVRPMHLQFIEPTKRYADLIVPEGGHNKVAIDIISANIKHILQK